MPTSMPIQEAPPAPPAQPSVAATQSQAGGTAISVEQLPRTVAEIEGLRARREILRDQLQRANNRRSELVRELRMAPASAEEGIKQRLALLDERILQIERDQASTERSLSNAPPQLLAEVAAQPRYNTSNMIDEGEAAGIAFFTFGAGILLTIVVGRLRRRFGRKRAGNQPVNLVAAQDPRIEKMSEAIDAIAEEVERIGEGQRFVTQLLAERRIAQTVGANESR